MPSLAETMYCSEQICIPPTFPYLMRQFAKAAIRTQPKDLLRWSIAYFRCLSLNIPPPVKTRLEFPIPRDHHGITPGWIKALVYQLQNNQTVPFNLLWDRWIGACLEHKTLIEILCLGGFTDPYEVPWLRFIALCIGHLTDDLTQTMTLVCEILTEEPEGGNSMIPLETFTDLYKFLASIDASKPQVIKNMFFLESFLDLWKQREEKIEKIESKPESVEEEQEEEKISEEKIEEPIVQAVDTTDVVSCPSLVTEESITIASATRVRIDEKTSKEFDDYGFPELNPPQSSQLTGESGEEAIMEEQEQLEEEAAQGEEDIASTSQAAVEEEPKQKVDDDVHSFLSAPSAIEEIIEPPKEIKSVSSAPVEVRSAEVPSVSVLEEQGSVGPKDDNKLSVSTIIEVPRVIKDIEDERILKEDLERLKAVQQEFFGEDQDELEKFKCQLIAEMPVTTTYSQELAIEHFEQHMKLPERPSSDVTISDKVVTEDVPLEDIKKVVYEDVYVDVVPGIGPVVPLDMVEVVCEYMSHISKRQKGMVMPRNIRHYNCPPLEHYL